MITFEIGTLTEQFSVLLQHSLVDKTVDKLQIETSFRVQLPGLICFKSLTLACHENKTAIGQGFSSMRALLINRDIFLVIS